MAAKKRATKSKRAKSANKKKRQPVSRAELARMAKRSRGAVTRAITAGTLKPALCDGGRKIDLNHAAAKAWLASTSPAKEDPKAAEEFADLLLRKRRAEVLKLELVNDEKRGELLPRELVKTHILGQWDAGNRRLLTDGIKTTVTQVLAMAASGATPEECEAKAREIASSHLELAIEAARRALPDA